MEASVQTVCMQSESQGPSLTEKTMLSSRVLDMLFPDSGLRAQNLVRIPRVLPGPRSRGYVDHFQADWSGS